MHYQQQNFPQSAGAGFPQSPALTMHHQPLHNTVTPGYGQGPPPGSRSGFNPSLGNALPHGNVYNPPRPPEVYTLPDVVNETFPEDVRRQFQCDEAGRVLFFTAPPLDRIHKGLSPDSARLGHSAKYLAGHREWMVERERKRKVRDEEQIENMRKKSPSLGPRATELGGSIISQASGAMENWFRNFDEDTARWQKEAGLEGWSQVV